MRGVNRKNLLLQSAKRRDLLVSIKSSEYKDLISLGCMYCGVSLDSNKGVGLDRIDSDKGYTLDNVTPCCKRCNVAKNDMKIEEFFSWVDRVYEFKKQKIKELEELNWTDKDFKRAENIHINSSRNRNSFCITNKE